MKQALESLYSLPALAGSPLDGLECLSCAAGSRGESLRGLLLDVVRDIGTSPAAADREAASLLTSYYVRRVGSHEVVAERLSLPRTTYYRCLDRAIGQVARRLSERQMGDFAGRQP